MRPSDCAETTQEAAQARALDTTQAGALQAVDAARWRRLVNASEMAFPVATIADDPENDHTMLYGRKRLEQFIDSLDEVSGQYPESLAATQPNAAPAAEVVEQTPMFYASAEQAHALQDRPDDNEGGVYLPLRKTSAGKFTMPLYVAPAAAIDAREQEIHRAWALMKNMRNKEAYAILSALVGWDPANSVPLASRLEAPAARPNAAGQEQGEVHLPTRGLLPWTTVLSYVEAAVGCAPRIDPDCSIGHQIVGINYNSLNRIMSALATPPLEVVGSSGMTADKAQGGSS